MKGRVRMLVLAMAAAVLVLSGAAVTAAKGGNRRMSAGQGMMPVVNVVGEIPRLVMDTVEVRAERVVGAAEVVEVGSQRRKA